MYFNSVIPVTVVIPCFKCVSTINFAIISIIQQTQKPAEVILVDDASDDDTLIVLRAIAKQYVGWVKIVVLHKNSGVASARNAGWAIATQPYIAFLDSDDAWHPNKIEIQYTYMFEHPEVAMCGHGHRILKQRADLLDWVLEPQCRVESIQKWKLLLSNKFVTPSIMLRSNIKQRFKESQRHMEDHLLWLEILFGGGQVARISCDLAAIYKSSYGEAGLSSQLWPMELGDLANLVYLYRNRFINSLQWLVLTIYSLLKYSRRVLICWSYLRWKI